jgi:uncharacterized membrane protein YdjX (TVP38/TMEM64 family)
VEPFGKTIIEAGEGMSKKLSKPAAIILVVLFLTAGAAWGLPHLNDLKQGLEQNLPYGAFVAVMAILPIGGFPISAFLIVGGLRFGIGLGLLAMLVTFPIHLAATYVVVHSFLRDRIETILNRYGYKMPAFSEKRLVYYTSVFVAVPSLPYAVKNYLLALGGVPKRLYFGLALPLHIVVGAFFVILGKSFTSLNLALAAVVLLFLFVFNRIGARLKRTLEKTPENELDGNATEVP